MRDPRRPRHFTDEFKRQMVDLHNAGKPKREAWTSATSARAPWRGGSSR